LLDLPEGQLRTALYKHIQGSLIHAERLSDYIELRLSSKKENSIKRSFSESMCILYVFSSLAIFNFQRYTRSFFSLFFH